MLFLKVYSLYQHFQYFAVLDLLHQNPWKNLLKTQILEPNPYQVNQNLRKVKKIFLLFFKFSYVIDPELRRAMAQNHAIIRYEICSASNGFNKDSLVIYPPACADFQAAPGVHSPATPPFSLAHFSAVSCVLDTSSLSAGSLSS